jgi:hypothetical protein
MRKMGTVPEAYYEYVMHYAPWFYVITTAMAADPPAGQKNVTVTDGTKFSAAMQVEIKDSAHSEWNEVDSVAGNVVTMKNNLAYTYYVAKGGTVDYGDNGFGKGVFAAAFAIEFLCQAYSATQFVSKQTEIHSKIIELTDWLLTQQCIDPAKKAYGGFKSSESSTQYYSIDAGRVIPALLKAYVLTSDADYLNAAVLAGYTFLYTMQQQPSVLGIHDSYYGGFANYVTITDTWDTIMSIENLYCLIALKMLAETYDTANASRYVAMMTDLAGFLRDGFEQLYLYYEPPPSGSGVWYRVGLNDTEVYDDPVSFALLGLYYYEAWSLTCQRVYNFVQSIRASGQYPAYWPEICWPGYLDVVTRFPACAYYDAITSGILWKIRKERDPPSFKLAYDVISKYSDEFLYWGPKFEDYSPITPQKAMANVTWLARMFLNYEAPLTRFTQILNSKGEAVLLYPIRQAVETVSYGEALDIMAVVSPVRVEEVLLDAGYLLNDYLAFYTFVPVRNHDKIRRKGEDYEIQTLQPFTYENQPIYFKSITRRLLAT